MTDAPHSVCIVEVDLDGPAPELPRIARDGRPYRRAAVAVRVHGVLVGVTNLALRAGEDGPALAERAFDALREEIDPPLLADGDGDLPRCRAEHEHLLERAPFASVIVATRDGEQTLGPCLESLLALDYPAYEIIV